MLPAITGDANLVFYGWSVWNWADRIRQKPARFGRSTRTLESLTICYLRHIHL
jgi:hypothetical protein